MAQRPEQGWLSQSSTSYCSPPKPAPHLKYGAPWPGQNHAGLARCGWLAGHGAAQESGPTCVSARKLISLISVRVDPALPGLENYHPHHAEGVLGQR